ncbi:MAG: NusG domain II-containing protein [Fidelibacterota bacterium]|nr:MAG: NusG domain II-containing protein [Candidatus Neomarinimicrobiota bacterium]
MHRLTRRRFIQFTSAGIAAIVGGMPWMKLWPQDRSYALISDRPEEDLKRLRKLVRAEGADVSWTDIQPTHPDLAILADGRLLDPSQVDKTEPVLSDFLGELRLRQGAGERLIHIDRIRSARNQEITFMIDGRVVEKVDPRRDYQRIVLDGDVGSTVFRLVDGYLSVTEASCRHEICRRQGGLRTGSVICAPNKLVALLPQARRHVDGISG